jgi:hypothetical protein
LIGSCLIKTDHLWIALVMNGLIGEPSLPRPAVTMMAKVLRAQERTDLFLGSSVLGVLLLVAVSSAFLWLAR